MIKSRSGKAMVLASGQGMRSLVGLVIAAVLARVFSKAEYATYCQTMLAYTFSAPFVMLGFDRALFYFMPTEEKRSRGVLVENLMLLAGGGLLLSLFLVGGGSELLARQFHNPALAETLRILAPYPLLMLPAAALPACLLALGRAGQVALFNVASRIWLVIVVLVPCLLWPGWPWPNVAIVGTVLATYVSTSLGLVLMFRACPTSAWRPTLTGLRRQVFFSVPLGLATLVATINRTLAQVMVAALCPAAAFAVFVNGAREIPLIGIITGSATSVLIVDYTKLYRQGELVEIVRLLRRATVKCAVILIPVMFFLLCMAPECMRLLFGPEYEDSAAPFRVFLLLLPARTLVVGAVLMATGNNRYVLIRSVLSLVINVVITWYAVRHFGLIGAAWGTVIATYASLVYVLLVLRRVLACSLYRMLPWGQMAQIIIAGLLPGLLVWILKDLVSMPDLLCVAVGGMVYVSVVMALLSRLGFVSLLAIWRRLRTPHRRPDGS